MTDVRELGQWCGGGGRNNDPDACHRAYATTFPNEGFSPGYFRTPREYRSPNVRVQRQRCVYYNLDGVGTRCLMETKQYQCAVRASYNCSLAIANDIRRPPQNKWCSAMSPKSVCEASYARAGNPWTVGQLRGRNYRPCYWEEEQGCKLRDVGFNCRDPDVEPFCIDVWDTIVVDSTTCGDLAMAFARDNGLSFRAAAARIGGSFTACAPCASET